MLMNTDKIQINGQIFSTLKMRQTKKNENLQDWERGIYEFILNWFNDDDFILQKTSGSTSEPKEIKLKKSAMVASAQKTIDFFQLKPNSTAWLCLPIDYIAGKMMVVRALVGNLNLIVSEPSGTPEIPDQPIDFAALVPLQIQKLIDAKADFTRIRKLIIGGAAINFNLNRLLQTISTEVFATYGMTETCSHIALQRINCTNPDNYFRTLPGISISKNDEGCLCIEAPELTDAPLQTNDVVELHSTSEFSILGRVDNIINSGGIKISPEQLENQISQIIGTECLVLSQPDELLGEKLVLVLEERSYQAPEVLIRLKKHFSKQHCPKVVCYINSFPRNESMKIDRLKVKAYLREVN
jgi:O-succinylbenzoic acid--CoA ligase